MPKEVYLTDEEYAAEKEKVRARSLPFKVIGSSLIRDCNTRESVGKGGTVYLDPEKTLIVHLVRSKLVEPIEVAPATAEPTPAVADKAGTPKPAAKG